MTEGTSPVDIAPPKRWADRYDSDRNLTGIWIGQSRLTYWGDTACHDD